MDDTVEKLLYHEEVLFCFLFSSLSYIIRFFLGLSIFMLGFPSVQNVIHSSTGFVHILIISVLSESGSVEGFVL